MKERPILFSGPMVQAILEGRKTQTRRISKKHQSEGRRYFLDAERTAPRLDTICPHGKPGDALWVRETWHSDTRDLDEARSQHEDVMSPSPIFYRADPVNNNSGCIWRPSIFMPRWASRILLEITEVRVERLQEISEKDAVAEGIDITQRVIKRDCVYGIYQSKLPDGKIHFDDSAYNLYRRLWESINGPGSWDANPWVWVIAFKNISNVPHS